MKKHNKSISILALLLTSLILLIGCTSKETETPKEPVPEPPKEEIKALEFDGKTEDLTGLKEIYSKEIDINRDTILDKVFVYGKEEYSIMRAKFIVFINGKDDKTLTTVKCGELDTNIQDIQDPNSDGIYDIIMDVHSGGTAGGGSYLLGYKDRTYKTINFKAPDLCISMENYYKVNVVDTLKGISSVVNLTPDQRQRYTREGIFNSKGEPIIGGDRAFLGACAKGTYARFIDINNDGTLELLTEYVFTGTFNADAVVGMNVVYSYENGEYVYKDIICQASEYGYNKDYKESAEYKGTDTVDRNFSINKIQLLLKGGEITPNGKVISYVATIPALKKIQKADVVTMMKKF